MDISPGGCFFDLLECPRLKWIGHPTDCEHSMDGGKSHLLGGKWKVGIDLDEEALISTLHHDIIKHC